MSLTMDSIIQRSADVVGATVRDELVLMTLEQGEYFGATGVGARIWEACERPLAVRDLCTQLQALYEVDADTCRRDILRFLEDLRDQGLLVVRGPEADAGA